MSFALFNAEITYPSTGSGTVMSALCNCDIIPKILLPPKNPKQKKTPFRELEKNTFNKKVKHEL